MKWLFAALLVMGLGIGISQTNAGQCVVVAFHDETQSDPDDIVLVQATWDKVAELQTPLPMIKLHLRFVTNTGAEGTIGYSSEDAYSLFFVAAHGQIADAMSVGKYAKSPKMGERETLTASVSATLNTFVARVGLEEQIIVGQNISFIAVNGADPGFNALQARAQMALTGHPCN